MEKSDKSVPNIDAAKFGEIAINGKVYYSDMTVYWNGKTSYRVKEHVIELGELLRVMKEGPEIIVIGTGHSGVIRITEEATSFAKGRGIQIYTEVTPKAAEMFNAFANEGRKVVGIFHATC